MQYLVREFELDDARHDGLRAAILTAAEHLDPDHQGEQWPDPIAWDGRPLPEQAGDLLALLEAESSEPTTDPARAAVLRADADRIRVLLGTVSG